MREPLKIKTAIYRLLARREYSSARLEQKLLDKGFDQESINLVFGEFRREGIINDQRFVESYLYGRRSQGYGPLRIRQELLTQGISKEMIEDQLDIADNMWLAEIKRVWQKRFQGRLPSDMKERARQFRFLQYRGFTSEQIENILNHAKTTDSIT